MEIIARLKTLIIAVCGGNGDDIPGKTTNMLSLEDIDALKPW
jgi:hypothetical protein